jgi:hypothetical protein
VRVVRNFVFLSLFPKEEDKAKGSPLFCRLFYYFILMGAKLYVSSKKDDHRWNLFMSIQITSMVSQLA